MWLWCRGKQGVTTDLPTALLEERVVCHWKPTRTAWRHVTTWISWWWRTNGFLCHKKTKTQKEIRLKKEQCDFWSRNYFCRHTQVRTTLSIICIYTLRGILDTTQLALQWKHSIWLCSHSCPVVLLTMTAGTDYKLTYLLHAAQSFLRS